MDHNTVLNVGTAPNADGVHMPICIHFIGAYHCVRPDENGIFDDNKSANDRCWINKGAG
jgi:hypothetical protein